MTEERLPISEPPIDEKEDTRPRPPLTSPESLLDTAEFPAIRPAVRPLLLIAIMAATLCLCALLTGVAGVAGYRDGLETNDARATRTLATGIAEQYATGIADLEQGYAELAAARFAWIAETLKAPTQYALDSEARLAAARTQQAYVPPPTDTLTETPTPPPTSTSAPQPSPSVEPSATLNPLQNPDYLFEQAKTAMVVAHYEDAIDWLDALIALAPDHRPIEVKAALMEALTEQGRIYLRGMNTDGEDRLARGVMLIYRAQDLGTVEPSTLVGEAIFVERYLNARDYVNGGYYDQALPVLEQLCAENCAWSYHGVSVQNLLDQARSGS